MKNIKAAAKILRYSGFKAKADVSKCVVTVSGISNADADKASKMVGVEVVAV